MSGARPPAPPPDAISARTLDHYQRNATDFWQGTRDHDVTQNLDALLGAIRSRPPFRILDLGCGPGRDLLALSERGHRPVGLDGCAAFVEMARSLSGCEVWQQDFLHLDLPAGVFDGVFANASLFHVPSDAIRRVLAELHASLRDEGVLFSSNPRGDDAEGWSRERYGVWWSEPTWRALLRDAGFHEVLAYYRPEGLPREQQPWFAGIWRKKT